MNLENIPGNKKINVIAEVLKVEDESTRDKVASILKGKKPRKKPIKKELEIFLGIISKEETEMMTKTIKETAGTVHPYDWK